MSAYLYPELKSKAEYKRALAAGASITAKAQTVSGEIPIENGTVVFEGPHYPQPHRYYGKAIVKDGKVTKIT